MQKPVVTFLVSAILLVGLGTFLIPGLLGDDEVPIGRWQPTEEVEVELPSDTADAELANGSEIERTAITATAGEPADEARVDLLLRGRVVDKFARPVPGASVWLDFGRGGQRGGPGGAGGQGGRNRRVPDPVATDAEGRFAFQGQTFRNLRVSLQVAHADHAPGVFDKDLGAVDKEMDLGDLVLTNGGEVIGRVTDLEGNGIPGATVRLGPENGNPLRLVRNRDNLVADLTTDQSGFFRARHTVAGDWSAGASAKRHTEGRSTTFAVEEDQAVEIDDIRLGPGFEVTGYVRDVQGKPIAKADVSMRGQGNANQSGQGGPGQGGRGRGDRGPGGGFDFGRDHSTTTDDQGRFFLEHLPGVPMHLSVRAEGHLDHTQDQVDVTVGQPLQITLQDGLRITGTAMDAVDGQLVTSFAVRAVRVRGLPVPGQTEIDLNALMERMRQGDLDEATRQQLRSQMEAARANLGDFRRGGQDGRGGPGGRGGQDNQDGRGGRGPGGGRDLGRPEPHPEGTFVVTGLQEGVYEVHLQSPEHARFRSAEVEVRLGSAAPNVTAALDRGVYVAGVVFDEHGAPVRGARVELRPSTSADGSGGRRRGRNGGGNQPGGNTPAAGGGPDFAAMGREFLRAAQGAGQTLEATTDADGEFVVKHATKGTYRLTASARGYADANGEPFELQADKSGMELRVGLLGSLTGSVRGLRTGEAATARVAAVPLGGNGAAWRGMGRGQGGGPGGPGGGPFQSTEVAPDGTYRIDGLTPGEYLVRSWLGSPQDLMRELMPQFLAGSLPADVKIVGGETSSLDITVTRPQVGEVAGSVLRNGQPAGGAQVELTRSDASNGDQNGGGRNQGGPGGFGGRMNGMFGGRSFQAAVAASGRFTIKDVPAGDYQLRVQASRRGGVLHEERITVHDGTTTERQIQVTTAAVAGTITADGTQPADLNGTVSMVPDLMALPENWNQWRREPGNTTFDARVQAGAFRFEALKPGSYLLVVSIRGRDRTATPVVVTPGDNTALTAVAGKPATPNPNAPGGAPGGGAPGGGSAPNAAPRNRPR